MKILLIDDHILFAKSLEIVLESHTCIESFTSIQDTSHILDDSCMKLKRARYPSSFGYLTPC